MLVSEHAVCVYCFFLYMVLEVHRNREACYVTDSVGNGGTGEDMSSSFAAYSVTLKDRRDLQPSPEQQCQC